MERKSASVLVLVVVLWSFAGRGEEESSYDRARIKLNYWTAGLTGHVEIKEMDVLGGSNLVIGEELDLEDDLGIEDPRGIPEIEAQLRLGRRHRVIAGFFTVEYEGTQSTERNLEIAGYTFLANTRLKTRLKSERYKFLYEFIPVEKDKMSLGIMGGVEYYNLTARNEGIAVQGGQPVTIDHYGRLNALIPVVGVRGVAKAQSGLGLYGEVAGMAAGIGDIKENYLDLDAGLLYEYQRLYSSLGYRLIDSQLDADLEDDDEITAHNTLQGWLLSVGVNL